MLTEFRAILTGARLAVVLAMAAAIFVAGGLAAWWTPWVGAAAGISTEKAATARLDKSINDPETGYVVRLDRCKRNAAAVEASLRSQNDALDTLSKDSAARLAAAQAALERARGVTDQANARIAVLMARPPAGVDTCARVLDIDDRVKEMLAP